jgi:hypothetical protein
MADRNAPSRDRTTLIVGAVAAAFGLYLCLVGLGLVPQPGRIDGPLWLACLAGLAFFCAGVAVLVRGILGMNDRASELPASTPLWMKVTYWLSAALAAASLATVGTWIAIGYGDNHISISGPFTGPVGESVGRAVFGVGTVLTWLMAIALARVGAKKIFGKKN